MFGYLNWIQSPKIEKRPCCFVWGCFSLKIMNSVISSDMHKDYIRIIQLLYFQPQLNIIQPLLYVECGAIILISEEAYSMLNTAVMNTYIQTRLEIVFFLCKQLHNYVVTNIINWWVTTSLCLLLSDTTCELCGFDFENRKALASHARAHLRQLGIFEWKADGATSPIELLSEIIRKDPAKVAEITRRYRFGDLYVKKVPFSLL